MPKVIWTCDGCGKEAEGDMASHGVVSHKPHGWFARRDADGDRDAQVACSRECIEKVAERTGKTAVVLPI